ncbi:unnamed protein product [Cladocopium goreaui]|uniref:NHR domain-containing protein n=1 Tax=Cladocopium goreaui TaxID=2562237 RepID=A0A9P1FI70_9DINO|nr:unnamed protein product [Cladocopium goreaui]
MADTTDDHAEPGEEAEEEPQTEDEEEVGTDLYYDASQMQQAIMTVLNASSGSRPTGTTMPVVTSIRGVFQRLHRYARNRGREHMSEIYQRWPEILSALQHAYDGCTFKGQAEIQLRFRRFLHECIFTGGKDQSAWEDALQSQAVSIEKPEAEGFTWSPILTFAATVENQYTLAAVNRNFSVALRSAVVWEGHDVTFAESHFVGLTKRGWCTALALMSCLQRARSLRLTSFRNSALRISASSVLEKASAELCPQVMVLPCSFCEEHCGEQIDLPSPRRLRAVRRPGAKNKGGGLLLGTGPLPRDAENLRSFAVRLEVLSPGERLDIGVTAQAPCAHFASDAVVGLRRPQVTFAEDLLSSWVVESSGLLVGSHAGLRIRDERWNARSLCAGLGFNFSCAFGYPRVICYAAFATMLAVTRSGEMRLSVNGEELAMWRAQIPCEHLGETN